MQRRRLATADNDSEVVANGTFELAGVDTVFGSANNDLLLDGAGNDTVVGVDGADALFVGTGDDLLDGDAGNDTLVGGNGNDTFAFDPQSDGDTILDWNSGDSILLFGFARVDAGNLSITPIPGGVLVALPTQLAIDILLNDGRSSTLTTSSLRNSCPSFLEGGSTRLRSRSECSTQRRSRWNHARHSAGMHFGTISVD